MEIKTMFNSYQIYISARTHTHTPVCCKHVSMYLVCLCTVNMQELGLCKARSLVFQQVIFFLQCSNAKSLKMCLALYKSCYVEVLLVRPEQSTYFLNHLNLFVSKFVCIFHRCSRVTVHRYDYYVYVQLRQCISLVL